MLFYFDYGDSWEFIIKFDFFGNKIRGKKYPRTIESKGKAPRQY